MNLLPKMEEVSVLTFTLEANFKVAFQAPFFFACLSFLSFFFRSVNSFHDRKRHQITVIVSHL